MEHMSGESGLLKNKAIGRGDCVLQGDWWAAIHNRCVWDRVAGPGASQIGHHVVQQSIAPINVLFETFGFIN